MQYEQIIDGYYEGGEVKGIDMLNFKPLAKDYFKSRPDMKQRVEKAINTQTYLATYQRGTRLGFKWITIEEKENYMDGSIVGKMITVQYFEETKNQEGGISLRFPTVKHIYETERDC